MANWALDLVYGVFLMGTEELARDQQQAFLCPPITAFQKPL